MKRKTMISWGAVLVVAVATILVSSQLRSKTAEVRSQVDALSARESAAQRQRRELRLATGADTNRQATRETEAPVAISPEAEALNQRATARRVLLTSWLDRQYRPFFRQAPLSPEQTEAFRQAVLSHWLRWCETVDVIRQQGLAQNDPVVKRLGTEEWARFTREMNAALGPVAGEQLKEFSRMAPAKPVADTVGALVSDSGEPLRLDQSARVAEALANGSARFRKGGPVSLDDIDIPTVLAQLQGVLTPTQLDALQTSLTARQAGAKLHALLTAAQNASRGEAGVEPPAEKAPAP